MMKNNNASPNHKNGNPDERCASIYKCMIEMNQLFEYSRTGDETEWDLR